MYMYMYDFQYKIRFCSSYSVHVHYYIYTVGHGKSEGDRVHINDFRIYYNDVIQHVQDTTTEYPGVPCILMGHSNVRYSMNI